MSAKYFHDYFRVPCISIYFSVPCTSFWIPYNRAPIFSCAKEFNGYFPTKKLHAFFLLKCCMYSLLPKISLSHILLIGFTHLFLPMKLGSMHLLLTKVEETSDLLASHFTKELQVCPSVREFHASKQSSWMGEVEALRLNFHFCSIQWSLGGIFRISPKDSTKMLK